mgnify:CR=1 FL=1
MNLLGRYLEDGRNCDLDLPAAHEWYKLSAEAGDFRGQFSHAAVLAQEGNITSAVYWLEIALEKGNINFLRVSGKALGDAPDKRIRELSQRYNERLAQLVRLENNHPLS